jgi:SGNH domain (fused to AT3 domains)
MLTALAAVSVAFASAGAGAASSENQIEQSVTAAAASSTFPRTLTPTLASVITTQGRYLAQGSSLAASCDPEIHHNLIATPKPCWFGASTSSHVAILFGDSNAGSWLPAIDGAMKALHLRLAAFIYPGCVSRLAAPKNAPANSPTCDQWHHHLIPVIRSMHATAIISAELGEDFTGSSPNFSAFASTWKATFDEVSGPRTLRILLGTTPNATSSIPACLARAQGTPNFESTCSPHYYPGVYYQTNYFSYIQRDIASAQAAHAHLIPVQQWFCQTSEPIKNLCPAVIGSTLVYVDTDHISIAYMQGLAGVLAQQLASAGVH